MKINDIAELMRKLAEFAGESDSRFELNVLYGANHTRVVLSVYRQFSEDEHRQYHETIKNIFAGKVKPLSIPYKVSPDDPLAQPAIFAVQLKK